MSHRLGLRKLAKTGVAGAVLAVLIACVSWAVAQASTTPAWTGTFDNFHSSSWNSAWGLTSDTAQCPIAVGTYTCNWGYGNLQATSDPTAPGGGQALKVTYPANSGPPSCVKSSSGCVLGGGQFYQDLTSNGQTALHNSPTIDLKYYYNFPVGFDFGKKTAGKMPGLYGGVPGCESGGQHCQNGWSTRYMWRGGSSSAPSGELYFYGGSGSGYGQDLCLGNWTFPADGKWHSIEQLVNISSGAITVWSDGKSVCQTTQTLASPVSGVFFSTFHGGHDTSWSPSKTTSDEFADFTLATDGPQTTGGGPSGPATPTGLAVTGTTSSSVSLSWSETNNSDPAASYKVYDGGTVVATPPTTSATISGLAAGSAHTYTVTAVDAAGVESAPSAAVTANTTGGGGGGLTVTIAKTKDWGSGFTDTGTITNSGAAVTGWNVQFDLDSSENIESASNVTETASGNHYTLTNTSTDATIAAGATQTFGFSGDYGTSYIPPANVTINGQGSGGGSGPATPTGLTVTGTTSSSVSLSWSETNNSDAATSYKIYDGSTAVATATTTSATISGLAAGSSHTYTITAVDTAGLESSHSSAVTASTTGGTGGGAFNQAQIDGAAAAPPFAWAAPTSAAPRPGTNPVNIGQAKVLYYLALVDKLAPGSKATNGTTVDSALLAQVRSLISGGKEPDSDGGLEMWGQAPVAQALLLLKNGPAWSELTSAEQNNVSLLEAAMGYGSNYTYNDANNFSSGICGFGNFKKTNNPNYRDGGVDTEIAAIEYFGASTWDSMLTSFNDATVTSQLNAAGLTNSGGCFSKVGSGANSAIAHPFVYSGHASSDLMGIWNSVAGATFDQTAHSTVGPAHIADGTTSPEEGQCCMGHEFNSTDSAGLRSSALYVFEGWMNVTGSRVTMSVLGNFNTGSAVAPYHIGSLDLIYKLHHGYYSYGLNQNGILTDDHGDPATDGPNVKGYLYDLDAYNVIVAPQS